jgi:hypothetical protein
MPTAIGGEDGRSARLDRSYGNERIATDGCDQLRIGP